MPQATPLPNTLGETVGRCQSLMGDPKGYLISRNFAVPFINQAYSDMAKSIKNASGKNFERVVEILNVPQGTSDLSVYQEYDAPPNNQPGPLVGLYDPLRVWVKVAGALPQYYTEAWGPRDTLPHTQPAGVQPGNFSVVVTWTWIGNKLFITPVAGPIDVQVYGRFNPSRLQKDEDKLLLYPDMTDTLAYASCGLFGVERANPQILQGYAERAIAGVDNIVADIVRQSQGVPRRTAKMGNGRGAGWCGWGSGSF